MRAEHAVDDHRALRPAFCDHAGPKQIICALLLVQVLSFSAATADVRATDEYLGADEPWLPTGRDALKSVRGLHRYISKFIPGVGEKNGLNAQLDVVKKHLDMPFLKFDSREAVLITAFRDSVLAKEADIIAAQLRPDLVGLDKSETMTSRSDRYNIFYWEEPWVGAYYWLVKRGEFSTRVHHDIHVCPNSSSSFSPIL